MIRETIIIFSQTTPYPIAGDHCYSRANIVPRLAPLFNLIQELNFCYVWATLAMCTERARSCSLIAVCRSVSNKNPLLVAKRNAVLVTLFTSNYITYDVSNILSYRFQYVFIKSSWFCTTVSLNQNVTLEVTYTNMVYFK